MKEVKVGTLLKNLLGDTLKCVKVDGIMYELKWVHEDGSLSKGSVIAVPSHLEHYEILN
ncbi:MAG: hypothetical protein IKY39_01855 [Clostridia bacterium]|nr:hypothetical protein [Clostridia bacterium]